MTRYPCDTAPAEAALGYDVLVCPRCGKPFTLKAFRQNRKPCFCSRRCSVSYWEAVRRGKEAGC